MIDKENKNTNQRQIGWAANKLQPLNLSSHNLFLSHTQNNMSEADDDDENRNFFAANEKKARA